MSDEPTYNADDRLEDALGRLATGISLENLLADAGEDAQWLGSMLELAAEVGQLRQTIPLAPPEASLQRMLSHAEELASIISPETPAQPWWRTVFSNFVWSERQPAMIGSPLLVFFAIGLLVTFLTGGLLGGGLALAAEDSLPGHSLYGLKRFGETVRLSLASDAVQREHLLENFGELRQQEVRLLLERGEQAKVVFVSRIESLTATEVTVDGLDAHLTPDTEIIGQLAVGTRVRVEGITRPPDSLIALMLTVLEPAPPSPTPTVTSTPTPTPTATARPITLTSTNTPGLGSTSDTIRLTPTSSPTVTPSIEPTPSKMPGEAGDNTSGISSPAPPATPTTPSIGPTSTPVTPENDNTSGTDEGDGNNSGPGSGDDAGNDNSGSDGDDNSGPGSGDGDRDKDSDSGSGSSKSDDDDDKSGSGKSE